MTETKVLRLVDYERRSRDADAVQPRNPADADVIALPLKAREDAACERFTRLIERVW